MHGAEFLVRCLKNEGVSVVFGVPGQGIAELLRTMEQGGIRLVVTHSSAAAVWAAAAYGALARSPGVAFAGAGPAAAEMAPALASCTVEGFPVVALVGGEPVSRQQTVAPEHLDISQALRPFCKQTASLNWPGSIRDEVRQAFRLAYAERPGAVTLAVAADVASAQMDPALQPLTPVAPGRSFADPAAVEEAARFLTGAARPVILAGHGVIRTGAHQELIRLAERTGAAVVTTFMGKAAFPHDHPLHIGSAGTTWSDWPDTVMARADVVLTVGFAPNEWPPEHWNRHQHLLILHTAERAATASAHYNPATEVVGDLNGALTALAERVAPTQRPGWTAPGGEAARVRDQARAEVEQHMADARFPVHPGRMVAELRSAMRRQDILVTDVGAHQVWACRHYPVLQAGTFYTSGAFQAMGLALPAAIGLAVGLGRTPDHRVAALTGDGAFLARAAEVETAVRMGLDLTVVVAVDSGYSLNAHQIAARGGNPAMARFGPVEIGRMAEAMGARAVQVQGPGQLPQAMQAAAGAGRPTVIAVPVDSAAHHELARPPHALVAAPASPPLEPALVHGA